jgi:hypothetical protein
MALFQNEVGHILVLEVLGMRLDQSNSLYKGFYAFFLEHEVVSTAPLLLCSIFSLKKAEGVSDAGLHIAEVELVLR